MTLPVFPALSLPGIGWPIKPTLKWRTIKQDAVSGRRTRFPLQASPIHAYELTLNFLRSASAYDELQTLIGFTNSLYGGSGLFAFYDPNDYFAASQSFGTGNGTSTTFQLTRAYGGFVEPVFVPYQASSLAVLPMLWQTNYAPNNLIANSLALGTSLNAYQMTAATGQGDPNGGAYAALLAEAATTNYHSFSFPNATVPAGAAVTFSAYFKQGGSRYFELSVNNMGSGNAFASVFAIFDLSAGAVTQSGGCTATISAAGNGYFRCGISGAVDAISTTLKPQGWGVNSATAGYAPIYAGSTSNTVYIAFPQFEVTNAAGAPSAFNPTLATLYYGSPSVSVAGTYVDPSTYTISATGAIVFATAPANSAALVWTGSFAWPCRFDDDALGIENFMYQLFELKSLKFSTELLP